MTKPQKFFKVDGTRIYRDGFTYSLHHELDPSISSAGLELRQSFHCSESEEQNCLSQVHVTGSWEMDKRGRKFVWGIVEKSDHSHEPEYRDTTRKLKFYRTIDESVQRNGFAYEFHRKLVPPKQSADLQLHRFYHCTMRDSELENCPARIYTTGQWKTDKRGGEYQWGTFIECNHTHEQDQDSKKEDEVNQTKEKENEENHTKEKDDVKNQTRKKGDEKNQTKEKEGENNQTGKKGDEKNQRKKKENEENRTVEKEDKKNQPEEKEGENNQTGKKEDEKNRTKEKEDEKNQTGKNPTVEKDDKENQTDEKEDKKILDENKILEENKASASRKSLCKNLEKKEKIRFYKYKETCLQHDGFVYSLVGDVFGHSKWRSRWHCRRKINGKQTCPGHIWTTDEWESDAHQREYQIGIILYGHTHEPQQMAMQGTVNDDKAEDGGTKFYQYKVTCVHRDGFAYRFSKKLKSVPPPWKSRMLCNRNSALSCIGAIWTTGEWETDSLGRNFQRGILRGRHCHKPYEQFLNEDDTAYVGDGTILDLDQQSLNEDDTVGDGSIMELDQDTNLAAIDAKRVTIVHSDINLVRRIRGEVFNKYPPPL